MEKKAIAVIFMAFSGVAIVAMGQSAASLRFQNISQALPKEVLEAINSAQNVKTIYPITGTESFNGQILKADEIVFSAGAKLVLKSMNRPWIAIVARKMKFADVKQWSVIERDRSIKATDGRAGSNGGLGGDGQGEVDRRGNPGGDGGAGGEGGSGESVSLPRLYIVVGELSSPDNRPLPGFLQLSFVIPGVDGGKGGTGGVGGQGGKGASGKEGATSLFDCKSGGGPGGTGGNGGAGGRGGRGGDGGNGMNLTYISTEPGIELLTYAEVLNVGGRGGSGGLSGNSGLPGAGGNGARSNGFCRATDQGGLGGRLVPLGDGTNGNQGRKGEVIAVTVASFAPLFP